MSRRKNIKTTKHIGKNTRAKKLSTLRLPWNWHSLFSNISKLTSYGQVEILKRV